MKSQQDIEYDREVARSAKKMAEMAAEMRKRRSAGDLEPEEGTAKILDLVLTEIIRNAGEKQPYFPALVLIRTHYGDEDVSLDLASAESAAALLEAESFSARVEDKFETSLFGRGGLYSLVMWIGLPERSESH